MVKLTIFGASLCLIGHREDTIFLVLSENFGHTSLIFQAESLVHTVLQDKGEVFDYGGIIGKRVEIVHSSDFRIHFGKDFHIC